MINELNEPTIARVMPVKDRRWNSFLPANAPQNEAKIGYFSLNTPTACPPRTGFPVNTRAWFREPVSSQHARFAFGKGCECASYVNLQTAGGGVGWQGLTPRIEMLRTFFSS